MSTLLRQSTATPFENEVSSSTNLSNLYLPFTNSRYGSTNRWCYYYYPNNIGWYSNTSYGWTSQDELNDYDRAAINYVQYYSYPTVKKLNLDNTIDLTPFIDNDEWTIEDLGLTDANFYPLKIDFENKIVYGYDLSPILSDEAASGIIQSPYNHEYAICPRCHGTGKDIHIIVPACKIGRIIKYKVDYTTAFRYDTPCIQYLIQPIKYDTFNNRWKDDTTQAQEWIILRKYDKYENLVDPEGNSLTGQWTIQPWPWNAKAHAMLPRRSTSSYIVDSGLDDDHKYVEYLQAWDEYNYDINNCRIDSPYLQYTIRADFGEYPPYLRYLEAKHELDNYLDNHTFAYDGLEYLKAQGQDYTMFKDYLNWFMHETDFRMNNASDTGTQQEPWLRYLLSVGSETIQNYFTYLQQNNKLMAQIALWKTNRDNNIMKEFYKFSLALTYIEKRGWINNYFNSFSSTLTPIQYIQENMSDNVRYDKFLRAIENNSDYEQQLEFFKIMEISLETVLNGLDSTEPSFLNYITINNYLDKYNKFLAFRNTAMHKFLYESDSYRSYYKTLLNELMLCNNSFKRDNPITSSEAWGNESNTNYWERCYFESYLVYCARQISISVYRDNYLKVITHMYLENAQLDGHGYDANNNDYYNEFYAAFTYWRYLYFNYQDGTRYEPWSQFTYRTMLNFLDPYKDEIKDEKLIKGFSNHLRGLNYYTSFTVYYKYNNKTYSSWNYENYVLFDYLINTIIETETTRPVQKTRTITDEETGEETTEIYYEDETHTVRENGLKFFRDSFVLPKRIQYKINHNNSENNSYKNLYDHLTSAMTTVGVLTANNKYTEFLPEDIVTPTPGE